jgi:hypothetical protein
LSRWPSAHPVELARSVVSTRYKNPARLVRICTSKLDGASHQNTAVLRVSRDLDESRRKNWHGDLGHVKITNCRVQRTVSSAVSIPQPLKTGQKLTRVAIGSGLAPQRATAAAFVGRFKPKLD